MKYEVRETSEHPGYPRKDGVFEATNEKLAERIKNLLERDGCLVTAEQYDPDSSET